MKSEDKLNALVVCAFLSVGVLFALFDVIPEAIHGPVCTACGEPLK